MTKFDVLIINEKTLNILTFLKRPNCFNELLRYIKGSSTTLKDYVDRLVEEGYIAEERMEGFPYKRTMSLTEKGRKAIKHMGMLHGL